MNDRDIISLGLGLESPWEIVGLPLVCTDVGGARGN